MPPLRIAFSTLACPDWSWDDVIRYGSAFGYDGVEIRLLQREVNLLSRPELHASQLSLRRRDLQRANFRVCGLASSVHLDDADPHLRSEQVRIGGEYLALAQALGAGFIRVFGDVLPTEPEPRRQTLRQIADGLKRLGDLAGPRGLMVLIETHGDFSASAPVVELMRLVGHPHVGVLWDTHHPWRFHGEPIAETWAKLKPWIRHTHWKDSVLLPDDSQKPVSDATAAAAALASSQMRGHQHADYVLFGGGEFPAKECLRVMTDDGYAGWHSLEWEKMWHPELVGPEVALPLFPRKLRELFESITNHR
jgi:sugar phosphate isomerase/epimerase